LYWCAVALSGDRNQIIMKLIVTRPQSDSEALIPKLKAKGHEALLCPLMEIKQRRDLKLPDAKLQAVCASSANGLEADVDWARLTALPFFAVGPQSGEAARKRGFTQVRVASGGNLFALAAMLEAHLSPNQGAVLYLSGADVSGDLVQMLSATGISVERLIAYDALALQTPELASLIIGAGGVMLYSPRTARLWIEATRGLKIGTLKHFCISPNVAARLPQSLPISVARTPDESGMMALLDQDGEAE
jgi:uroporphyrinogen-III synthase